MWWKVVCFAPSAVSATIFGVMIALGSPPKGILANVLAGTTAMIVPVAIGVRMWCSHKNAQKRMKDQLYPYP